MSVPFRTMVSVDHAGFNGLECRQRHRRCKRQHSEDIEGPEQASKHMLGW